MCVQCRHAACACTCDGLAVDMVLDVAGSKDAWNAGHGGKALQTTLGDDVAIFHLQLIGKNFRIGLVANGYETTLNTQILGGLG